MDGYFKRNQMQVIYGKKIGMTSIKSGNGKLTGVTVVKVDPSFIVGKRTADKDGYHAFILSIGENKKKSRKPVVGQVKAANLKSEPEAIREIRTVSEETDLKVGDKVVLGDIVGIGDKVNVQSNSKGKGFQGVMKRWNFQGGPASHGSNFHRHGGSFGMAEFPGEILKGKKMPGRMGNDTKTLKNMRVLDIVDGNLICIKGGVPGAKNTLVKITVTKKASN